VALSQLKELGEQAVAAVAASLAWHELKQSAGHDTTRAALIAASDRCERIAAASINPSALLDELTKAIAVLEADIPPSEPPPARGRPVLRLIVGGLSS
jgi:hypothetical protein